MKQLIKKVSSIVVAASLFALSVTAFLPLTSSVSAQCSTGTTIQEGINCANGGQAVTTDLNTVFTNIVNVLLFIIGALCVIMLIWGGIRYTTSAGNASHVTAAKNTIMYALIGLVVAFLAFAIVNWVLGAVTPK